MIYRFLILSSLIWLSSCSNYDPELVARLSTKEAKHLFGAVERGSEQRPLDVVDIEPPPEDYVLLQDDIPNLIITPHTAWAGRQARQNTVNQIQQNIEAFIAGEPRYQVN